MEKRMNKTLMLLIQLQNLMLRSDGDIRNVDGRIACLRAYLPTSCLEEFDRLLNGGRLPVAVLTDMSMCGNCRSPLSPRKSVVLREERNQLHSCQFCGCFLYSPVASADWKVLTEAGP